MNATALSMIIFAYLCGSVSSVQCDPGLPDRQVA